MRDIETWLNELKRLRANFEKACVQNLDFEIERTLYYSALVVRKFSETPFVRRGFLGPTIDSHRFAPAKGSAGGSNWNWTDAESHFDFRNPIEFQISILDLCSTLIHARFVCWRPEAGEVQTIFTGAMRPDMEAIEFTPSQYSQVLQKIENYKFKPRLSRRARKARSAA
jgi:hypothetical protein